MKWYRPYLSRPQDNPINIVDAAMTKAIKNFPDSPWTSMYGLDITSQERRLFDAIYQIAKVMISLFYLK